MTFDELRKLKDGWEGAGSLAPTTQQILTAERLVDAFTHFGMEKPTMEVERNGDIELDWYTPGRVLLLVIKQDAHPLHGSCEFFWNLSK